MGGQEFVVVRVTEVVTLSPTVVQGIGELDNGRPCAFLADARGMAEIAEALKAGTPVEVGVRTSMLRLPRGVVPQGGSSESEGVTGSEPVTGDERRLP